VVIPHSEEVLLEDINIFKDHLVIGQRNMGLTNLKVINISTGDEHIVDFGEEAYVAYIGANPEFDSDTLRINYSSMTTPWTVMDYDMNTRKSTVKKVQPVLGGFDAENYVTERIWAEARDGTEVPISIVYRKDLPKDRTNPMLVYGYGSYGANMEPWFNSNAISLLDRGWVYATAHIRGGAEMGRQWYEEGKMYNKKNTFTDFIDCTEHLVREGYADPEKVHALGGSAGGLLMGAVVNMRPDLYNGVVAAVPFVDIITTMSDESIPLTTFEYDEWGNPNQLEQYEYMKSYSPYDNVTDAEFPNMLVTTGFHDSQVQFWEPAKWVAKIRDHNTGDNKVMLYTDMEAGHGGASGRLKGLRDTARNYAFLITVADWEEEDTAND
jgi:oligopeptidase B